MKTYINGALFRQVTFQVAGLNDPFAKELFGTYLLDDFPAPGESVTVEWSEASQNFIIVD